MHVLESSDGHLKRCPNKVVHGREATSVRMSDAGRTDGWTCVSTDGRNLQFRQLFRRSRHASRATTTPSSSSRLNDPKGQSHLDGQCTPHDVRFSLPVVYPVNGPQTFFLSSSLYRYRYSQSIHKTDTHLLLLVLVFVVAVIWLR